LYATFLGVLYKEITFGSFIDALKDSALQTGVVMFIVSAAQIFAWIITTEQAALSGYEFVVQYVSSKWAILFIINIVLLTPPLGLGVYIACNLAEVPAIEGFKKTLPFLIPLIVTLLLVTYIPEITLFIPNLIW
jgi:C4-dicarboxylate transporter, DctM subunit